MKAFIIPVAIAAMLSCNVKSDNGMSFNFATKEGKGPIKTKEVKLDFDEIKVSQSISAEIVKSSQEKVVVSAPADILEDVLVDNKNGKLHIHFKPNLNISARNVSVKIFAKDFSHVEATSSADITIRDQFTQDKTSVKASSSGEISGPLEANDLFVDVSSSGSFTGKIWAINLKSEASSSGDIKISGKTKSAQLQASSSGTIDAASVAAQDVVASASSSGTIRISASNQVRAKASSAGDVVVKRTGNLNILERSESSGGSVTIN